jgi:hypothetical protein
MQLHQRSSFRRASSERRRSLTGISWNKDIEADTIISSRAQEQDSFMALVHAHEAGVFSAPTAARIPDTKTKNRPDQAACSSGLAAGAPSPRRASLPKPEAGNIGQRSSLRRAFPERRRSLTEISWNKDIEAACIISPRAQGLDSFMALVQSPPPLRPSSASPFDVPATAAGAAAASRAGVKLAMANSSNLRNHGEELQAPDIGA